jgi:hypothetical protein
MIVLLLLVTEIPALLISVLGGGGVGGADSVTSVGVTGKSLGPKSPRTDSGEGTGAGTNGMGTKGGSPGAGNTADTSDAGVCGGRGNGGESKGDQSGGVGEVSDDIGVRD